MKKAIFFTVAILIFATKLFSQAQPDPYKLGWPLSWAAKPGDAVVPLRIVATTPILEPSADDDVWALVEVQQIVSPQAATNGPNEQKLDISGGDILAVGDYDRGGFFGLGGIGYKPTNTTGYVPGDSYAYAKSYRSSLNHKQLVWLTGQTNGEFVTVNMQADFYFGIAYWIKSGFLGLGRSPRSYTVRIPTTFTFTGKVIGL